MFLTEWERWGASLGWNTVIRSDPVEWAETGGDVGISTRFVDSTVPPLAAVIAAPTGARAWRLFTYAFGTALRGTCGRMGSRVSTAVTGPHIGSVMMTRRTHLKPFKHSRQHCFVVSLARRRYTGIPRTVPF